MTNVIPARDRKNNNLFLSKQNLHYYLLRKMEIPFSMNQVSLALILPK